MKMFLKLPVEIRVENLADQKSVLIDFGAHSVADWYLGLCQLKEDLIESLIVSNRSASFKLAIQKDQQLSASERAAMTMFNGKIQLSVSETEIDY